MDQETEFFVAVTRVAATLLGLQYVAAIRYEPDNTATIVAESNDRNLRGTNLKLDGPSVMATILQTGRPATVTSYAKLPGDVAKAVRSEGFDEVFGTPITVSGDIWGAFVAVVYGGRRLPPALEGRLDPFADVVATAIESAQVRDEMRALAAEQAALRRIATIVAAGAEASVVFEAVCAETGELVGATGVNLARFTEDAYFEAVGAWSRRGAFAPIGTRWPLTGDSLSGLVWRTAAPARRETYEGGTSELALLAKGLGFDSSVAVPISVEERLWGTIIAGAEPGSPMPPNTEERMSRFAELVAIAVLNATARSELIASRARIVAAGDEARRRIERNLHDGVQQRLIALGVDLQTATAAVPLDADGTRSELERVSAKLESVLEDIRELSRGLHPVLLSRRGLGPSLRALARGSPLPVRLSVDISVRPPQPIEIAIYYAVSELLTNATRHAEATVVHIEVTGSKESVSTVIKDDGVGGADPQNGTGLIGLIDRVEALGGHLVLSSPAGAGTNIRFELPTSRAPVADWAHRDRKGSAEAD
jgi:signal transduction histidine kinase